MAFLFAAYALVGAALYKASRQGGEVAKGAYFVAFPFHAIGMPVLSALGGGAHDLLRSKGFWAAAFLGAVGMLAAGGADPCTAAFGAFVLLGIGKLLLGGIKDLIDE